MMKALSIRQPWLWAIMEKGKDIENRSWRTHYRGPILLHASRTLDKDGKEWLRNKMHINVPGGLARGQILARAKLVDCVSAHPSPWFAGPYGFVLRDIEPVTPYTIVGKLGLFEAPEQEELL